MSSALQKDSIPDEASTAQLPQWFYELFGPYSRDAYTIASSTILDEYVTMIKEKFGCFQLSDFPTFLAWAPHSAFCRDAFSHPVLLLIPDEFRKGSNLESRFTTCPQDVLEQLSE
jgi:hypothetical protein